MAFLNKIAAALGLSKKATEVVDKTSTENENWTVYWRENVRGDLMIAVDQWLRTPKASDFSNWAVVSFTLPAEKTFRGMPEPELLAYLNEFEDRLDAIVEGENGRRVASQTGLGTRSVWYCVRSLDLVALIKPALSSFTGGLAAVEWSTKFEASKLLPTHLESQLATNTELVKQLQAAGDDGTARRLIMHWIFLREDTRLDELKKQLTSRGYRIEDQREDVLQFSKQSDASAETVNAETKLLNELCDTFSCFYDGWETAVIGK